MRKTILTIAAASILALASCSSTPETVTSGTAAPESDESQVQEEPTTQDRHGTEFDGRFAGPFDGTAATLGSCELIIAEGTIAEPFEPFWWLTTLGTAWSEVVSIDLGEGLEDPGSFSTVEGLGASVTFVEVPGAMVPDRSEAIAPREPASIDEWFYLGEQLSAMASELDRGQRVYAAASSGGWVTAASVDPASGSVQFVGLCAEQLTGEFSQAVTYLNRDGRERSPAEVLDLVMLMTFENVFPPGALNEILSPAAPDWLDQDPMERQIDLEQTPQEILDELVGFTVALELPPTWLSDEIVVCPRQDLAWARLCVATLAHEDGVIAFEMLVRQGEPVEVWMMDANGLNPKGPIFVIDGEDVKADAMLPLVLTADTPGSVIYTSGKIDAVQVEPAR